MKRTFFLVFFFAGASVFLFAQPHISTQPHQGSVTSIVTAACDDSSSYFTAGSDGFIIKWTEDGQGEHYQISNLPIKYISCTNDGKLVAAYETDGGLINRVSVWDWETMSRKYARRFSDPVTSLAWSANGTYLMVGTTNVKGTVFIAAETGDVVEKLKDASGVVTRSQTSASEKTAVMYSPSGSLSYYDLNKGTLKQRFSTVSNLSQPVIFNNGLFLGGTSGTSVSIIYTLNGRTLSSAQARLPVLVSTQDDENLYYLVSSGKNTYTLSVFENNENTAVSDPKNMFSLKMPDSGDRITCGIKFGDTFIFGTQSGSVLCTETDSEQNMTSLVPITQTMYEPITDVAATDAGFYLLTRSAVYTISPDTGMFEKIADNTAGHTQILSLENRAVLWSKGTVKPVLLADFSQKTFTPLFTPKMPVQILRSAGTQLIDIENNATVNSYSFESGKIKTVYAGTSIQDAVMVDDRTLYVAKSSATNPPAPLIAVDVKTQETVPLPFKGTVSYALSADGTTICGILIDSDSEQQSTRFFSYDTDQKKETYLLQIADDDLDSFTFVYGDKIYNDIGQDCIRCLRTGENKPVSFTRSSSLPVKIAENKSGCIVLNRDGSVSWYSGEAGTIDATWYIATSGELQEY